MPVQIDKVERSWGREKARTPIMVTQDPTILVETPLRRCFTRLYAQQNVYGDVLELRAAKHDKDGKEIKTETVRKVDLWFIDRSRRIIILPVLENLRRPWERTVFELPPKAK